MFRITQKVTKEYGRLSALPHHQPTHVAEIDHTYFSEVRYVVIGSAFQLEGQGEDQHFVYVTRHEEGIVIEEID